MDQSTADTVLVDTTYCVVVMASHGIRSMSELMAVLIILDWLGLIEIVWADEPC